MKKRIIGIDVARALAVIGMIIVNFKIVCGDNGAGWLKSFAQVFDGKAAATFVVLAGIGLALMTNSAIQQQDQQKLKRARTRIFKRALFLFVIGLSYIWIWPADILHFYGVYMVLTLLFVGKSSRQILIGTFCLIVLFPLLVMITDYEQGWNFTTLEYADFWTFQGFLRNLFYNGFHPVIPWAAFMLFGMWYGRQDLHNVRFLQRSLGVSLSAFLLLQVASAGAIHWLAQGNPATIEELSPILGTDPMPPMPIYMLNGISISIVVISACILIARNRAENWVISTLNKTGQLALTFYVAHVVLGMGILEEVGPLELGAYSIQFSVIYALAFSLLAALFASLWLRYFKSGPLEWIMRSLTN